jgi:aspartyl-tRNA(Asn)/glutamyl-tRNA(Gln) amidotransferase subunit A
MPLGMQIAASWFDEATVFRVAAAYENASPWRTRRPVLRPNDTHTALPPAGPIGDLPEADEEIRRIVEVAVQRAGLHLTTRQFAELCQAAPYALAMAQRIGRKRERTDEPAYGFLVDRHLL